MLLTKKYNSQEVHTTNNDSKEQTSELNHYWWAFRQKWSVSSVGCQNCSYVTDVRLMYQQQQQQHKLYLHDYNYVVTVLQKL